MALVRAGVRQSDPTLGPLLDELVRDCALAACEGEATRLAEDVDALWARVSGEGEHEVVLAEIVG